MSKFLIDFLGSIGISFDAPVRELADTLRALIVEEWTGPFLEEYQQFFDGLYIQEEAVEFSKRGHFSRSLGDAMPLAMANVLPSIFGFEG